MAATTSDLVQSQFYSPVFNAAIFDGAFRIYFAQHQEPHALRIYFQLQQNLKDFYNIAKNSMRESGKYFFIMLYPDADTFEQAFQMKVHSHFTYCFLGEDHLIGVKGLIPDSEYVRLYQFVETHLQASRSSLASLPEILEDALAPAL